MTVEQSNERRGGRSCLEGLYLFLANWSRWREKGESFGTNITTTETREMINEARWKLDDDVHFFSRRSADMNYDFFHCHSSIWLCNSLCPSQMAEFFVFLSLPPSILKRLFAQASSSSFFLPHSISSIETTLSWWNVPAFSTDISGTQSLTAIASFYVTIKLPEMLLQ